LLDRTLLPTSTSLRTPAYLELNTSKGLELTTRTLNAETDLATAGRLDGLLVNAVATESIILATKLKVFAAPLARSATNLSLAVVMLTRLTTSRVLMTPPRRQLKPTLWEEERRMIDAETSKRVRRVMLSTRPLRTPRSLVTPRPRVSPLPSLERRFLSSALSYLILAQFKQAARLLDVYSSALTSRRATSA